MKAFHGPAYGFSSHCTTKTMAKKMAKSVVGKSKPRSGRSSCARQWRWGGHYRSVLTPSGTRNGRGSAVLRAPVDPRGCAAGRRAPFVAASDQPAGAPRPRGRGAGRTSGLAPFAHRLATPRRWSAGRCQPRALRASMSLGTTLCTSPTTPRSATEKMGASWSLLMATMFFEFFMPTRCWVAPEIPQAR